MSLNSYAINKAVLNGTVGGNVFTKAIAALSTSLITLIRNTLCIKSVVSISASTKVVVVIKAIAYLQTSVSTVKKLMSKLFTLSFSTSTSLFKSDLKGIVATSASAFVFNKAVAHPVTVLSTSIALIFKAITHPLSTVTSSSSASVFKKSAKSFVTALTSTALVIKAVFVTFITTVVSTITLLSGKAFFKILSVTQSAVSTLSIGKVFLRIVSLVVTSTLSLAKGVKAIQAVVQTPIVVLLKPSTRLLLLVTTVVATVVSFLYRLAANSKDIVYVPTKRTALQLAGFISILVRLKKTGVTASKQDNLNG